jgi:hypothetical protein
MEGWEMGEGCSDWVVGPSTGRLWGGRDEGGREDYRG